MFLIVFLPAISFKVSADVDLKSFEFRGYRFGSKRQIRENLMPWEMNLSMYGKIDEIEESNPDLLKFGKSKLIRIIYKYFDNELYEISVMFEKQNDCNHAREANEMIQIKYGLKTYPKNHANPGDYLRGFSNGKISISINCSYSMLDFLFNPKESIKSEAIEKYTEIIFQDTVASKISQNYKNKIMEENFNKSQKMMENKIRENINF